MPPPVDVKDLLNEIGNIDAFIKGSNPDFSFDDVLAKVPNSKDASLFCIHMIAASQVKQAACDHHSPDPDWMRVLAVLWKHFPEFSTNLAGERFL
jgi:hypothetical protein